MRESFRTYKEEVAAGTFPAAEHTFKMDETVLDKLYKDIHTESFALFLSNNNKTKLQ